MSFVARPKSEIPAVFRASGFPRLRRHGLTASEVKEIENKTLSRCRARVHPSLHPLVAELPADSSERRILVFIQPATAQAHLFREGEGESGGKYFVRISRETSEARNGILRELLLRKGAIEPWDRRPCPGATPADIDLLALRDTLSLMGHSPLDFEVASYLSESKQISAFVPSLCLREALTGQLRPRNFALLLFGRNVTRFIPGAVSLFSRYRGVDRQQRYSNRDEICGTLLEQWRKLRHLLELEATQLTDKEDLQAPNAFRYPLRALYEALGNALAHRDYEQPDPTRITVFANRIEFVSPGGLPLGLDLESFRSGKLGPKRRNQVLAWFFNRLQLAQAEGQGISTILHSMREAGSPPPIFEADATRVSCLLPAHPRQQALIDLAQATADFAQAERRLRLARSQIKLDSSPEDEVAWEEFLGCQPEATVLWDRLQGWPDWKSKLSRSTLLAIASICSKIAS